MPHFLSPDFHTPRILSVPAPTSFHLITRSRSLILLLIILSQSFIVLTNYFFSLFSSFSILIVHIFILTLRKSWPSTRSPYLTQLIVDLRAFRRERVKHLTCRLSSLSTPDDLFNLFSGLQSVLGGNGARFGLDDSILLDPNSQLGIFVRRCILAFNQLSFEGVCHLLTNIGTYCKESPASCSTYQSLQDDDFDNDSEELKAFDHLLFGKVSEKRAAKMKAWEGFVFHLHAPRSLFRLIEDSKVLFGLNHDKERDFDVSSSNDGLGIDDYNGSLFLRTNWQVQGYLREQADLIEKHGSSYPFNAFESVLNRLKNLAPELHRVHYLRYLNTLYHDDYLASSENLLRYFDYSAGAEGIDIALSSFPGMSFGRYEIALLCLGTMHCHFGHPKQALEVLSEAVQVSQQHNDDTCLSYTLATICNLLSEIGILNASGMIGSSSMVAATFGSSLSIQQQLLVLLTRSLKRAESLKLTRLVAANHLAMAKFDLTHVKRPLLSFGPKSSLKLKTYPSNVLKELRLSSYLLSEFGSDGAPLTIDGAFSTTWLKNLKKPMASSIFLHENELGSRNNTFQFDAQPSPIHGSVLHLAGSSYLLRATAWELYGSAPLARMNALVNVTCFADASSSADVELGYVKLIQSLAIFKGYTEAFNALKVAEDKFISVSKSRIQILKLQLLHDHALHQGNLKLAQRVCDELGVLASSVTGVDMELKAEACLRHARTLLSANQYGQAAAAARSLFFMCHKFNLQVENATTLLLFAEIHKRSGSAVLGLPYALASLSFCQSFNLDLLEATATLTLAELWLSLGSDHAKRALTLVNRALPIIFGHGGLELCSRANMTVAKCYLSDPSFSVYDDPEIVLDPLRQASEELEVLEFHELAAEAFYLKAMVFNKLGRLEERDEVATSFKKHISSLENPHEEDLFRWC
ncbi:hypothetical protein Scep_012375 [Stephania cephalantha]|uniref:Anaphase-promoting complex subunit 5 n=1 Tax=Stephania cephalantha TaxID=152367 RepID=A0AAP0P6F3_9MAGN